jgi:uncharacterized membrane protein
MSVNQQEDDHVSDAHDGQERIDRIEAFNEELHYLEKTNVLTLDAQQKSTLSDYQQDLIKRLVKEQNVNTSATNKQLSIGMKFASLIGAVAMASSLFFLFYQFWGFVPTSVQVFTLIAVPLLSFVACIYLQQKGQTYFAKITGLISLASFVLNLSMFGQIFNIAPSPNAFLIWSVFALLLAYATVSRVLLSFAILSAMAFLSMQVGVWSGLYWIDFGERPEDFILPSLIIFALPSIIKQLSIAKFANIYRIFGLIFFFMPILVLANWGKISYLPFESNTIETMYQLLGFLCAAGFIVLGIKAKWQHVVNTANVFFMLFLYTKLFDWWWEWMPKYLFFFLMGLIAIGALVIITRIRNKRMTKEWQS